MNAETIMLFVIIALVMIGIPVLLGRRTGQNPMEILFGSRVNNTIFARKTKKEEDSSKDQAAKSKASALQKNSSRQDLMKTISSLISYGRRNRFYTIVPGTLMHGDDVASLAVLMVTRNSVLGFNCFGYGGTVHVGSGEGEWRQVLNGEEKKIDSPIAKNKKQKEILDAVLKECGYQQIRTEIFGVFTAPDIILKNNVSKNTRCCSQKTMMEILKENRYLEDGGITPKELGGILEKHTKKA